MNDQPTVTPESTEVALPTYKDADFPTGRLLAKGSRKARIVSVASARKPYRFMGVNVLFLEEGKAGKKGFLTASVLLEWALQPVEEAKAADPEPPMSSDEAVAYAAIDRDFAREMYKRLDAEDAADAGVVAETSDTSAGERELQSYVAAKTEAKDTDIAALEEQISRLEDRIESLEDDASEANAEVSKLTNENIELLAAIASQRLEIGKLTDERSKALHRADVAENSVSRLMRKLEALPTAVAQQTIDAAPVKEFMILRNVTPSDMCRNEKEGWEIQHMQFVSGEDQADRLNIVYFRHCRPAPIQPQPTAAVKTVAPDSIINPADELIRPTTPEAELHLEEADLIDIHAELAPDLTALPSFSQRWASKFEQAQKDAARVYRGALRSNPLIASRSARPTSIPAVRP